MAYAYLGNGMEDFPCVVAEVGSFSTKIGYAGEDFPRSHFQSTTAVHGRSKQRCHDFLTRPFVSSSESSENKYDQDWDLENPVDLATGWILPTLNKEEEEMKCDDDTPGSCQHSILSSYLEYGCDRAGIKDMHSSSTRLPLLLVEKSYNPPPVRQTLMEELFEGQDVPATFLARDAVCACYAVGRSTATVVDVGYRGTVISPVYDGFVETKGILQSPVGGRMMDELVLETLDTLFRKDWMKKHKSNTTTVLIPPDGVLPLYQTRMPQHTPRKDIFHHLARLDLARQCKEEGSGAGVGPFGYSTIRPEDSVTTPGGSNTTTTRMISSISKELHQQYANAPKTPYKLPDGTVLHVSQTLRFDVTECLFGNHPTQCRKRQDAMMILQQGLDEWKTTCKSVKGSGSSSSISTSHSKPGVFSSSSFYKALSPYLSPSSMGELSSLPISNMVCDSVFKCDVDQQPQLLGNVVLCGGGSCFTTSALLHSSSVTVDAQQNSMPERLREEVEAIIHNHTPGWRVKVSSPGITERAICSWLGGSILGSLGAFHEMWITKKEYEEHGSNIVHRKCP